MVEPARPDPLLPKAGRYLIGAGLLAAFTGGAYGLATQTPGIIIASVLLLMGYGVVGYLLMERGERHFHLTLPGAAILVVGTLFLFQTQMSAWLDSEFVAYFLAPGTTLLLVFAAGALLSYVVEHVTQRVSWPHRNAKSLHALLHVAAYAPVWCAFVYLYVASVTPLDRVLIVGASGGVAIAACIGGHAAARGSHPGLTLVGSALTFLACGLYLIVFMGGSVSRVTSFGQFHALIGLILAALPVALSAVAWVQLNNPPQEAPPGEP